MRTLTIGTRAQAEKASVETLFRPVNGHTATRHLSYDGAKYGVDLRGRTLEVRDGVVALYTERRRDADGPYWTLRCIST